MKNGNLVIIRGLPGSGKSTLAKQKFRNNGYCHYEADMFFERTGKYIFDASLLRNAHKWCQKMAKNALLGDSPVVVSNTFVRLWEMQPYFDMANSVNVPITVIKCVGNYTSIHAVPRKTIERMNADWEPFCWERTFNPNGDDNA